MTLKQELSNGGLLIAPGCFDPLSAKIVQSCGFKAAYLGGWAMGAHLALTEPRTLLPDITDIVKKIRLNLDIPLVVDGNAGFGDLVMMERTIKEFENAGVNAIHVEDQIVPKRMHYHEGKIELVSVELMKEKLNHAFQARKDSDFLIIARTDAGRNQEESFAYAIERANLYSAYGADLIMVFPRNWEELETAPQKIDGSLVYVASEGLGRPIPSPKELETLGYKMVIYPITPILGMYKSIKNIYTELKNTGRTGIPQHEATQLAKEVLETINLQHLLDIESQQIRMESRLNDEK